MKNFSLSSFVIELFFRLQAVTILLLLGIAVIVSIPDKITKIMELIQLSLFNMSANYNHQFFYVPYFGTLRRSSVGATQ